MYSKEIKDKVIKLRKEGNSYHDITRLTNIPKSTLSVWLGKALGTPFSRKTMLLHLAHIRPLAAKARNLQKIEGLALIKKSVDEEVTTYPLKSKTFQKSLLAMLYWAEGAKHERVSGLKFVNTDPKMIRLFLDLLRNCYSVDEKKFRVCMFLHYYHPIKETRKFWSVLTNIPENQFSATIIKKRGRKKRYRKNFMGICALKYLDSSVRKEILAIGYSIAEQIDKN